MSPNKHELKNKTFLTFYVNYEIEDSLGVSQTWIKVIKSFKYLNYLKHEFRFTASSLMAVY